MSPFKQALNGLAILAVSLVTLADLPGLAPAPRPVTTVTMTKSGANITLNWTVSPAGSYDFFIYRGISHAEYRAEVLQTTITDGSLTWTDTGAITRTRQGYPTNDFYRVYAVPKDLPSQLAARAVDTEYSHDIRNNSLDVAVSITNGGTIANWPSYRVDTLEIQLSQSNWSKADLDVYNLPVVPDDLVIKVNPAESYPRKVSHAGYYAGASTERPAADEIVELTIRQVPLPSVERTDNLVDITWSGLTQDYNLTVTAIDVIRTYKGVGDGEPMQLIATVAPGATGAQDDISAVTPGWYIFWQLRLHYADGTLSTIGPSSEWVKR